MTNSCPDREEQISRLLSDDLTPAAKDDLERHLGQCETCRDYLGELRADDRLLAQFAGDLVPAVQRVETRVLESLQRKPSARPARMIPVWRVILNSGLARMAAAASVAVIALAVIFVSGPKNLQAQVLRALEKAQTVHVTVKSNRTGQWQTGAEVWYAHGLGVLEQEVVDGVMRKRLDDGKNQWRYRSGSRSVMKTKSADPDAMGVVARILYPREFREHFTGRPVGTKTVDGVECKVYSQANPDNTWRMDLWIDNDMLIRGWEKRRPNDAGSLEVYDQAAVEYNQPIEKTRFLPDFGPDVTVVDAAVEGDKFWENRYDLKNVLYTKEAFGLVFAVHQLKRCEGGLVFLVSSIRPTTETIRELGPIDSSHGAGSLAYGGFQLDSSWERLPDGTERSYQPWTLAELIHNGLQVKWEILIPKGAWPEKVNECKLSAYIHARAKLQEKLEKAGLEWYKRFRPLTMLPLPETTSSLSNIISIVYAEAQQLEPVASEMRLFREGRPDPKKKGSTIVPLVKPSEIPPDQYESECRANLKRLKAE
jgi:outer membrane lipoprotein-sorting protein